MKKKLFILIGIGFVATSLSHASSRMERVMWTDRGITNPPLSESPSSINESIDRFWNLPAATESVAPAQHHKSYRSIPVSHLRPQYYKQLNNRLSQGQRHREKRGYLGINLFNMIPLIDIVHGSSETNTNDHVEIVR